MDSALDATPLACPRSQVCHVPTPRSPRRETASGSLPPGRARGRPRGSWLGGVDDEGPARECRAVEACHGGLRGLAVRHGHGAIALGAATHRVDHDVDDPHRPIRREELSEGMRRHTGPRLLTVMCMLVSSGATMRRRSALRRPGPPPLPRTRRDHGGVGRASVARDARMGGRSSRFVL